MNILLENIIEIYYAAEPQNVNIFSYPKLGLTVDLMSVEERIKKARSQ